MRVLIRGCELSGTNITFSALKRLQGQGQLEVRQDTKHTWGGAGAPPGSTQTVLAVVKHPISWSVSIYRSSWFLHWMMLGKRKSAGQISWRDATECIRVGRTLDHWADFYSYWLEQGARVVRYEDMITDPSAALSAALGRELTATIDEGHWKKGTYHASAPFDLSYYTEERWRDEVEPEVWELASVCHPLMDRFGYAKE